MNDVKLPPLPEPGMFAEYWATQMQAYARAAIEANTPAVKTENLTPVIQWLEAGCDPKHAATELRLLAASPQPAPQPDHSEQDLGMVQHRRPAAVGPTGPQSCAAAGVKDLAECLCITEIS